MAHPANSKRVAIIGAGPAGLTTALQLIRSGTKVDVYEASDLVGGMCRSFSLWGQTVDLGPHRFFSSDEEVNRFWLSLVENRYHMVNRQTRIYFRGRLIEYPLQPLDVLAKLGWFETFYWHSEFSKDEVHSSSREGKL